MLSRFVTLSVVLCCCSLLLLLFFNFAVGARGQSGWKAELATPAFAGASRLAKPSNPTAPARPNASEEFWSEFLVVFLAVLGVSFAV